MENQPTGNIQTWDEQPIIKTEKKHRSLAPNAVVALVTGILSINFSFVVIPGIILAIIAMSKADQGYAQMGNNTDDYNGVSMLKAGRTTGLVGLILSIASIIFWIAYWVLIIVLIDM